MKDLVYSWIEQMLTSVDGNIASVVSILSAGFWGGSWCNWAKGIATSTIEPIALTIISICFFVEFLKITIQMDILKWEYALKCFFKFVFAKVCIDVAFDLLDAIYATAAEWVASIGASGTSVGNDAWQAIKGELDGYKFLEMAGVLASSGIIFIAIWVVTIIIQVIAYARKFEITLLLAISPLPCAFLPLEDGGASRIPKKFFINFAGTCLQGVFIIMSVKLYEFLCTEEIDAAIAAGGSPGMIAGQLLLATLVLVMAVTKSSGWAKAILDAM